MEINSLKTPLITHNYNNSNKEDLIALNNNQFNWNPNIKNEEVELQSEIEKIIEDINTIKEKLDVEFTMENLMEFKKTIKSFLEYYVDNGLSTKDILDRNEYGILERKTIVQKLEDNLVDLEETMALLGTKSGHLEMLQKIGEIEGLLLKLFL